MAETAFRVVMSSPPDHPLSIEEIEDLLMAYNMQCFRLLETKPSADLGAHIKHSSYRPWAICAIETMKKDCGATGRSVIVE